MIPSASYQHQSQRKEPKHTKTSLDESPKMSLIGTLVEKQIVLYMDASKAFDVMDHDAVLTHLFNQRVKNQLWHCYDNLYTNIKSVITCKGSLSFPFEESQGICQGGVSSTSIVKATAKPRLHHLDDNPSSLQIGHIQVGTLMVADDLALSSGTVGGIKDLITEAELDAFTELLLQ